MLLPLTELRSPDICGNTLLHERVLFQNSTQVLNMLHEYVHTFWKYKAPRAIVVISPNFTGKPGGSFIWTNSLSLLKCLKGAITSKTFNNLKRKTDFITNYCFTSFPSRKDKNDPKSKVIKKELKNDILLLSLSLLKASISASSYSVLSDPHRITVGVQINIKILISCPHLTQETEAYSTTASSPWTQGTWCGFVVV